MKLLKENPGLNEVVGNFWCKQFLAIQDKAFTCLVHCKDYFQDVIYLHTTKENKKSISIYGFHYMLSNEKTTLFNDTEVLKIYFTIDRKKTFNVDNKTKFNIKWNDLTLDNTFNDRIIGLSKLFNLIEEANNVKNRIKFYNEEVENEIFFVAEFDKCYTKNLSLFSFLTMMLREFKIDNDVDITKENLVEVIKKGTLNYNSFQFTNYLTRVDISRLFLELLLDFSKFDEYSQKIEKDVIVLSTTNDIHNRSGIVSFLGDCTGLK